MKKYILAVGILVSTLANAKLTTYRVPLREGNFVTMNSEFTSQSVAVLAEKAREVDAALPKGEPMYLILNTPGGEIFAGTELIANLNSLIKRPIVTVTIFSASMGFQTVQGLNGPRLMVPNGTLMSHKARGGISGEFPGQLDQRYSYILGIVTDLDKRAAARSKGKHTLQSYQALVENEYWCSPERCVEQGFADGVAEVTCDASLAGTYKETENLGMLFGLSLSVKVEYSKCPTITTPISVKMNVNNKPLENVVEKLNRDQREIVNGLVEKYSQDLTLRNRRYVLTTGLTK
jgi:ATP-dependent protease ClpP protease subunit